MKLKNILALSAVSFGTLGFLANKYDSAMYYWTFPPEIDEERLISIENVNEDSKKLNFTHKNLEESLGIKIYGKYSNEDVSNFYNTINKLKKSNSKIITGINSVVIVPNYYTTDYLGKAIFTKMVLKSDFKKSTLFHEAAHNYSSTLSQDFWKEWEPISEGTYVIKTFPLLTHIISSIIPSLETDEEKFHFPKNGILTKYGKTNMYEDVAEYVADLYVEMEQISKVSSKDKDKVEKKLQLLFRWGFIDFDMYQDAMNKISTKTLDNYIKSF